MNTKLIIILLLGIVASICMATQCEKEPPGFEENGLPLATQIGANTFGALVNGELFVRTGAGGGFMAPRQLGATYTRNNQAIRMRINRPQEGKSNPLTLGYFSPDTENFSSECWMFACENCPYVFITKLDTINRIVSGTFGFIGKCASIRIGTLFEYIGDSVVHVTEGRSMSYYSYMTIKKNKIIVRSKILLFATWLMIVNDLYGKLDKHQIIVTQ